MKKFSGYILALFIVIVAFLYLLDWSYTYIYATGTPRNKVSYLLSLNNQKINYIFLGSSRVDNNIDPEVIESVTGKTALNLGVQAAKLSDYLLMLQLLKKQNITADIVFIQVDYVYNIEGNSDILKSSIMPYINNDVVDTYIKQVDPDYKRIINLPFYRYLKHDYTIGFRQVFNSIINNKPENNLSIGYSPKYGKSNINQEFMLPEQIIEDNEIIDQINKFALANNIEIIYFTAPFCKKTKNLEFISKLQNKIPGLLNFSSIFAEKDSYFFNCSHLNDAGAKEFSKIFGEKILTRCEAK